MQLSANDMVRIGDWIEMPKFGADGDVMEVALTTVKVRNWDKTITTIPTYALIADSFKNWRGMERVRRAAHQALRVHRREQHPLSATPEMIEQLSRIEMLRDYIERKAEGACRVQRASRGWTTRCRSTVGA